MSKGKTQYSGGAMGRKGGPSVPLISAPARMDVPGTGDAKSPVEALAHGRKLAEDNKTRAMGDYVNRRRRSGESA